MDFKSARDWSMGKRTLSLAIKDTELSRVPGKYLKDLLDAEHGENPAAILLAWAALLDPTMGAVQLGLAMEDEDDGER